MKFFINIFESGMNLEEYYIFATWINKCRSLKAGHQTVIIDFYKSE
jgi:hypothetical protein